MRRRAAAPAWLLRASLVACFALAAEPAVAQVPGMAQPVPTPAPSEPGPSAQPSEARGPTSAAEGGEDAVKLRPSLGQDVVWRDDWPRFQTWQYVLTGVQMAAAMGSLAIPSGGGRVDLGNDFDRGARDALRAEDYDSYIFARDLSDVGIVVLINHRIADSAFVTWWGYDKGSVAWQMAMIDLQTVSFTAAVNGIVAGVAARERPYANGLCLTREGELTSDCLGSKRYRSFFSGHSSTAFTLAGLTCMHHAHIPLYGHPVADGAACVSALGMAGTVAMMRVVADQHWVSDVLVGSSFGLVSGLAIPWIFHYSGGGSMSSASSESGERRPPAVTWNFAPTPGGIAVSGAF